MTRRTRFLVNEHPAIASQWHSELNADLDLAKIGPGSHKAVFWRCDDGHVWQAQVHSRVAGSGCPKCAGYVPRGRTTLSEHSPGLVAEWHPRNDASPDRFGPGSQRKVWWRCHGGIQDKPSAEQLAALAALSVAWAGPAPAAPASTVGGSEQPSPMEAPVPEQRDADDAGADDEREAEADY